MFFVLFSQPVFGLIFSPLSFRRDFFFAGFPNKADSFPIAIAYTLQPRLLSPALTPPFPLPPQDRLFFPVHN